MKIVITILVLFLSTVMILNANETTTQDKVEKSTMGMHDSTIPMMHSSEQNMSMEDNSTMPMMDSSEQNMSMEDNSTMPMMNTQKTKIKEESTMKCAAGRCGSGKCGGGK